MQTMHGSTGPNTLIITDILHDDILSMNIVSDKHEQASQSGWLGLHKLIIVQSWYKHLVMQVAVFDLHTIKQSICSLIHSLHLPIIQAVKEPCTRNRCKQHK